MINGRADIRNRMGYKSEQKRMLNKTMSTSETKCQAESLYTQPSSALKKTLLDKHQQAVFRSQTFRIVLSLKAL